jgi:hypothetical protein
VSTDRRTARPRLFLILGAGLALAPGFAPADEPAADVLEPPPFDQFLVIPLRAHVLTASDLPEVDCRLTFADVERVVGKVNGIWHNAGVHWSLESVTREPAARQGRFRLARDLDGPNNLAMYRMLVPRSDEQFDGLHVYYLHRLPVNGVWMGGNFALVQETARLREVAGGIDEPLPRVTAHELGHALGLTHRQDRTNLLASGTTGTRLNATEVEAARKRAKLIPGCRDVAGLKEVAREAEAAGNHALARRYRAWLGAIPGGAKESSD